MMFLVYFLLTFLFSARATVPVATPTRQPTAAPTYLNPINATINNGYLTIASMGISQYVGTLSSNIQYVIDNYFPDPVKKIDLSWIHDKKYALIFTFNTVYSRISWSKLTFRDILGSMDLFHFSRTWSSLETIKQIHQSYWIPKWSWCCKVPPSWPIEILWIQQTRIILSNMEMQLLWYIILSLLA